jgi:hypothetical protein
MLEEGGRWQRQVKLERRRNKSRKEWLEAARKMGLSRLKV